MPLMRLAGMAGVTGVTSETGVTGVTGVTGCCGAVLALVLRPWSGRPGWEVRRSLARQNPMKDAVWCGMGVESSSSVVSEEHEVASARWNAV